MIKSFQLKDRDLSRVPLALTKQASGLVCDHRTQWAVGINKQGKFNITLFLTTSPSLSPSDYLPLPSDLLPVWQWWILVERVHQAACRNEQQVRNNLVSMLYCNTVIIANHLEHRRLYTFEDDENQQKKV